VEHEIVVRGEAEVRAMPDLAVLRVVVDGEGSSQDEAYDAAARLAEAVDAVFNAQSASIGRVATAALVVQPRIRWHNGEEIRTGWRAGRVSVADVRALDRVGNIAAMLVGAGATVTGPSWELDHSNNAYHQARVEAAQDARKRAEAYAGALGAGVGPLMWIAEPGLRPAGDASGGGAAGMPIAAHPRAALLASGPAETPIDVAPGEIAVHAAVEVGFHLASQR
jgi:uncharacterized protein YggE